MKKILTVVVNNKYGSISRTFAHDSKISVLPLNACYALKTFPYHAIKFVKPLYCVNQLSNPEIDGIANHETSQLNRSFRYFQSPSGKLFMLRL